MGHDDENKKRRTNTGQNPDKYRTNTGKSGVLNQPMTPRESEVYRMIFNEHLTPKQAQIQLNISRSTFYGHLKSIKNKGFYRPGQIPDNFGGACPGCPGSGEKIRFHALEFRASILWADGRYKAHIKRSNIEFIENATIQLYRDVLIIHINNSFYGRTPAQATARAIPYINRLFMRLENDLKVNFVKSRRDNIKLVRCHYAETDNEISKDYEVKGERLQFRTTDDNKVWLHCDNSLNLHELETTHPETAGRDMDRVLKQANDWRDHDPPTNTELANIFKSLLLHQQETDRQLKETAGALNSVVILLTSQIPKPATPRTARADEIDYIG